MTRDPLPDRRPQETFNLRHTWLRGTEREVSEVMTVSVGRYGVDDPRIGEVFLTCDNHHNERAIALWHDIGVLISYALQHGATISELSAAMARGEVPIMDRTERVTHSPAGTVLDALADIETRDLADGLFSMPTPIVDIDSVLAVLRALRLPVAVEVDTQAEIAAALLAAGAPAVREVILDKANRIDVMVGGIGIEVKVKGGKRDILRQLQRYAEFDQILELVLVTAVAMGVPETINGKRVHKVSIGRAWL